MQLLSRRSMLGIAAVVDIAHHARPTPVAAKALAGRHALPPRHLETLLLRFECCVADSNSPVNSAFQPLK